MTSYIVTFGQPVQWMKRTDTQTDRHIDREYGNISSIIRGFIETKSSKVQTCNIAILFVCLSVAFKFLNRVTDCYNFGVNIMMTLGGTTTT